MKWLIYSILDFAAFAGLYMMILALPIHLTMGLFH